jgi:hypothetical protein
MQFGFKKEFIIRQLKHLVVSVVFIFTWIVGYDR